MPDRKINTRRMVPPELFFYAIPLTEGKLRLTRTMLEQHYQLPKGRKLYYGNQVEYVSYQRGIITVTAKLNGRQMETLYVHAEPETLHVACSCGMPGQTLCVHAYIGLYDMAWTNILNLKQFYWPGFDANEAIQRKFLDVLVSKRFIQVEPKPQFGNLFRPVVGFRESNTFSLPVNSPPSTDLLQGNRQVIAFCIGYGRMDNLLCQLPVLIPCSANTSGDNSSLVGFSELLTDGNFDMGDADFTASQLQLITIAADMYRLIKVFGKGSYHPESAEHRAIKATALQLWEKTLPLLALEPFTCAYSPVRLRFIKGKAGIRKSEVMPCRVSTLRPELYFILKAKKDHYSLSSALALNGAAFPFSCKTQLFAMDKVGWCYLMNAADADDLLNWINTGSNRLTILKEHFAEFENGFLSILSKHYSIYFVDTGTGKRSVYQLGQMAIYAS